ncbi:hypothetical protein [Soonwooa sp.]|uniref:hypothetical protein n=1 Tax=Soonwooa sp. TaxID=1938592 RepID=UPI00262A7820|nr:hypothetical protein [Soonwooa sp.]
MKNQHLFLLLIFLVVASCAKTSKENKKTPKKHTWDFTQSVFKEPHVQLLNVYDVFSVDKLSDSLIVLNTSLFNGWKVKRTQFSDTLQLSENFIVKDNLGNNSSQILSYTKTKSRANDLFFQLVIDAKPNLEHSLEKTGRKNGDIEEVKPKIDTMWYFNYRGKLFINKKELKYFSDDLYYK